MIDRRIYRFFVLWVPTTTIFYVLQGIMVSAGLTDDPPWVFFVFALFVVVFLCVSLFEPSLIVNVAFAFAFWCPWFVLIVPFSGSGPERSERIIEASLLICRFALGHAAVQGVLAFVFSRLRKTGLKRRAIEKYRRKLGPLLRKRYGRSDQYTAPQIQTTIEKCGFNVAYSAYALAMYSARDDFDRFPRQTGEAGDYDALRKEIGDLCFSGRTDFSVAECTGGDSCWHDATDGFDAGDGFDADSKGGCDGN